MYLSEMNEHGGDIYSHKIKYDFSANLNPLGMPAGVQSALRSHISEWEHYPDPHCRELIAALSTYENVPEEFIVCGNGAADLIYRIVQAVKPRKAVLTAPTFSEYEKALLQQGTEVVKFRLDENSGFAVTDSITEILDGSVDMLFLCSPNNPTGRTVSDDVLKKITEKCLRNDIIFVCDECFLPFVENAEQLSVRNCINQNVIALKAFTKIYSMAGIRLGYAVFGGSGLADMVRHTGQYWSVSSPAQTAGFAALQETGFIERTVRFVSEERDFLFQELKKIGFTVYPSEANFLLFRCELPLDGLLLKEGIALRNCQNYDGLGAGYFRTAVRTHEENTALIEALRRVANG